MEPPTPQIIAIMASGYALVMGCLAAGLRLRLRQSPPRRPRRPGWPALVRHLVGTAVGGYLLLGVVVVGYYYGVERLGGQFLRSAFTGTALLIVVSLPLFLAVSWFVERHRQSGHDGPTGDGTATRSTGPR